MKAAETDYVDIGLIHIVDNQDEFDKSFYGEFYAYVKELKRSGKIKAIGMSSHNPLMCLKAVEEDLVDVIMFSMNPAYDLEVKSNLEDYEKGTRHREDSEMKINPYRRRLYQLCESKNVGIIVMKSLMAGRLLSKQRSPFNEALSSAACVNYALSRPGVVADMIGYMSNNELDAALEYYDVDESQKEYAHVLAGQDNIKTAGKCMYCNHCQPCPQGIDIASVTKYLNLVEEEGQVRDTVRGHYQSLSVNASDCTQCGQCEKRCPFEVDIRKNMRMANRIFN